MMEAGAAQMEAATPHSVMIIWSRSKDSGQGLDNLVKVKRIWSRSEDSGHGQKILVKV